MLNLKMTLDGKLASVNKMYLRGKHGGVYLAPEVVEYREKVAPIVEEYYANCADKYEGGLLTVTVHVHTSFFTKGDEVRRLDIDNFAKQTIDSVFPPLGIDDKMIFDLRLRKVEYAGNPKCNIHIKEIPGTQRSLPNKTKPKTYKKSRKKL